MFQFNGETALLLYVLVQLSPLYTHQIGTWNCRILLCETEANCFGTLLLQLRGQISRFRLNCLIRTYNASKNHRRVINEHDFYVTLNASIFLIKSIDRLFMFLFISLIWAGKRITHRSYVKPNTKKHEFVTRNHPFQNMCSAP